MNSKPLRYRGYRFPPEIISPAVWLYHRFCLSFRDVEDLLAQRGIAVSYEAVRLWCLKFGPDYSRVLRRRQGRLGGTWYLDKEELVALLKRGVNASEEWGVFMPGKSRRLRLKRFTLWACSVLFVGAGCSPSVDRVRVACRASTLGEKLPLDTAEVNAFCTALEREAWWSGEIASVSAKAHSDVTAEFVGATDEHAWATLEFGGASIGVTGTKPKPIANAANEVAEEIERSAAAIRRWRERGNE